MVTAELVLWAVTCGIVLQRITELRLARHNARVARLAGAVEHGAAHYPWFFVLHGTWMAGFSVEAWIGGPNLARGWPWWAAAFVTAQVLRYWAISTLGSAWNTRILVVPGHRRIERGPYRLLRHPNYIAVAIELLAIPAMFGAWWTAIVVSIANAFLLLLVRIPAEERAWTTLQPGIADREPERPPPQS